MELLFENIMYAAILVLDLVMIKLLSGYIEKKAFSTEPIGVQLYDEITH